MQVYIQVKRTAETLNQCDRTGVICGFCVTGFFANGRGDGAIDDAQSLLSIPTVAVKQPELAKKTLPQNVIADLLKFRKNHSLKGLSLKGMIEEGRR